MRTPTIIVAGAFALLTSPTALASEHAAEIHQLQTDVQQLEREVEELRSAVPALLALAPTFTSFMPDFAERFHVMHRAGDAGDWAVAAHELQEMQRTMRVAKFIDPEKAALMEGMLSANFEALNEAIEKGDRATFDKGLVDTLNNCNACHIAVGSPFVRVGLDADRSLSMRHPHALSEEAAPTGHHHGSPEQHEQVMHMEDTMQEMMHQDEAEHADDDAHHDENDAHRD